MTKTDIGILHLDCQDGNAEHIGDLMYKSLRSLIEISRIQQRDLSDLRIRAGNSSWVNDFCTIKCGTSRRSGHSTSIARYIIDKNAKALVLSVSINSANIIKESMVDRLWDTSIPFTLATNCIYSNNTSGFRVDFSSIDSFNKRLAINETYDIVFVDCASCVTADEKMRIQMKVRDILPPDKSFHLVYME